MKKINLTKRTRANIKNFILITITTLALCYMGGFVFLLSIIDVRNILTCSIWCLCGIWLATFFYVNIKEEFKGNDRKINK